MRANQLIRLFRRLPPQMQLVVGVLGVVVLGGLWLTGNLPASLTGEPPSASFREQAPQASPPRTAARTPSADETPRTAARDSRPSRAARAAGIDRAAAAKIAEADFDYFILALSWSPTYCEDARGGRDASQCAGARPYAFILHGLWPQHERGWPENCGKDRPWVPRAVIAAMQDIMPSRGLIIHEYRKHGTCTGLSAEGYYAVSRAIYNRIKIPPRFVLPEREQQLRPGDVKSAFLKANQSLRPDMLSVECGRRGRLREVRICFTKDGSPRACGRDQARRRGCRRETVRVPPVR
ncbi:MAG: ribonuclease T [Pseudomonadota bacterium]